MKHSLIFAAALLIPVGAAAFEAPPRYDVEAHCNELAGFGGSFSESTLETCFRMEQEAYDKLKPAWASISASVRGHCDELARFGGHGSYSALSTCIRMEQEAAAANKNRTFRY
jgi:hypothetical protein